MIRVCDGEKIYFLILKADCKKSEAVKIAFELCGKSFSLTSGTKHDKYGDFLVDRDSGEYWCIGKGAT